MAYCFLALAFALFGALTLPGTEPSLGSRPLTLTYSHLRVSVLNVITSADAANNDARICVGTSKIGYA